MFGYNNGIIGGVIVLPSFHDDFKLPSPGSAAYNNITSNIVSLLQIGGLVGAVLTFPVMKLWGRKIALSVAAGVYTIGALLQVGTAYDIGDVTNTTIKTFSYGRLVIMYIARIITGLGTGSVTVIVPLVRNSTTIIFVSSLLIVHHLVYL